MSEKATVRDDVTRRALDELVFFERGAMSFLEKPIQEDALASILRAAASCSWLGRWRLVAVTDTSVRLSLVQVWQDQLRKIEQERGAEFVERWKKAPLFVVFCQPREFGAFQWVPSEIARVYGIQEVGGAVRSLELMALTFGVGLHGIMGIMVPTIADAIKEVLKIPTDYEVVFFGIMGYPNEEAAVKFPDLKEICYANMWGGIRPRTGMSKLDIAKEVLRSFGMESENVLVEDASSDPHRISTDPQERENREVKLLTRTLIDRIREQVTKAGQRRLGPLDIQW